MRRLIFALVGAVLFGAATFFYGLILFPNGLDWLTLRQFAIGLVVFGTTTGALLGLIAAWVSGPSDKHRTQFLVVGTVVGLLTGLVYGLNTDEVDVTVSMHTVGPGYPFLWWVFTPLISVIAWTLTGGVVGGILGVTAALFTRGTQAPTSAMRARNLLVGILLLVEVTATILILTRQPADDSIESSGLATVLVSRKDIHIDQALDPLIEDSVIVEIQVPRDVRMAGALTDFRELRGSIAVSLIRRHEQILANNVEPA